MMLRATQLLARYLGMLLLAWAGYSTASASPASQIASQVIAAAVMAVIDHWLHRKRTDCPNP